MTAPFVHLRHRFKIVSIFRFEDEAILAAWAAVIKNAIKSISFFKHVLYYIKVKGTSKGML